MSLLVLSLIAIGLAALVASGASWGPGVHIRLATRLLDERPASIPDEGWERIEQHREHFLYGNIAADIINFKKYGGLKNHCHHWGIKERIEALISDETEYAFLAGYLCHLAADVVAHRHFVPYQVVHGLPPRWLGHVYWEARADNCAEESHWETIDSLRTERALHRNDLVVNRAVRVKALPLRSNKWIFNNVLLARSRKSWREQMDRLRRQNPQRTIGAEFLDACLERAYENMVATFTPESLRELRNFDPNGHEELRASRQLRRTLIATYGSREKGADPSRHAAEECFGVPPKSTDA